MGDLLLSSNLVKDALKTYEKAVILYRAEKEPMGLAYTLSEIIRCNRRLGFTKPDVFKKLAAQALVAANKSGVESVLGYVLNAIGEFLDQDPDKIKDFLEGLTVDD